MTESAVFAATNGEIDVTLEKDTVWLRQDQMAELFGRKRSVTKRHIGNIFKESELGKDSNLQNIHIANSSKPAMLKGPETGHFKL